MICYSCKINRHEFNSLDCNFNCDLLTIYFYCSAVEVILMRCSHCISELVSRRLASNSFTALHLAALYNYRDCAQLLITKVQCITCIGNVPSSSLQRYNVTRIGSLLSSSLQRYSVTHIGNVLSSSLQR